MSILGIALAHWNDVLKNPTDTTRPDDQVPILHGNLNVAAGNVDISLIHRRRPTKTWSEILRKILTDPYILGALLICISVYLYLYFKELRHPTMPIDKTLTRRSNMNPLSHHTDFTQKKGPGYFSLTLLYAILSLLTPMCTIFLIRVFTSHIILNKGRKLTPDSINVSSITAVLQPNFIPFQTNGNEIIDTDGKAIAHVQNTAPPGTYNYENKNINGMLGSQAKAGIFYYPIHGLDETTAFGTPGQCPLNTLFHTKNGYFGLTLFFEAILVILLISASVSVILTIKDLAKVARELSHDESAFRCVSITGYTFSSIALLLSFLWIVRATTLVAY